MMTRETARIARQSDGSTRMGGSVTDELRGAQRHDPACADAGQRDPYGCQGCGEAA